jgi:hypothetical protein
MNTARREFFEGLGLTVLALFFTGMLLTAAIVAIGNASYLRATAFGLPGLFALYWALRFARAQFAAYREQGGGER